MKKKNKKIKYTTMVATTAEEMAPKGSQNIENYKISGRYTVIFYTFGRSAVFKYLQILFSGYKTDVFQSSRSSVLFWISQAEKEKLFEFERRKKEEYKGYEVYYAPEKDEEKPHEKK